MAITRGNLPVIAALAIAVLTVLAGCAVSTWVTVDEEDDDGTVEGQAWVVVMFEDRPKRFDDDLMKVLLDTELAADRALLAAGAGAIDGNDVGQHGYELYFAGHDAETMWKVLEPVFARAPVPWTRVELYSHGLDAKPTKVLSPRR